MASICEPFHKHQPSWSLFRSSSWQEREKSETSTALLSQPLCHPSTCFTSHLNPATESMHKSWREERRKGEERRGSPRRAFVLQSRENADTLTASAPFSCSITTCSESQKGRLRVRRGTAGCEAWDALGQPRSTESLPGTRSQTDSSAFQTRVSSISGWPGPRLLESGGLERRERESQPGRETEQRESREGGPGLSWGSCGPLKALTVGF